MALTAGSIEIKLFADIARLQSDMNKANKTVDAAMRNIDKSVGLAKRAFSSLAVSFSALQVIKLADDFKRFDSQLKLSTKNLNTYTEAYQNVIRISKIAQSEIGAIGVLYARLNNNLRDFNVTQREVSDVTETISLALRTNNATVQETNSVMLQLSQSFGSGKLNGQEFLAVAEGAPLLLRQLAKSMGVPFGALKDLSAQGKITREELLKAFTDPEYLAALRTQVKEVGTVSSAMTVFTNNLKLFVGEQDKATGATRTLSSGILLIADNINLLVSGALAYGVATFIKWTQAQYAALAASRANAAQSVIQARVELSLAEAAYASGAAVTRKTAAMANNAAATTLATSNTARLIAAQRALAVSTSTAATAVRGFGTILSAFGGWIGLAITAVVLFGDKIYKAMNPVSPMLEQIRDKAKEMNEELAKTPDVVNKVVTSNLELLGIERTKLEQKLAADELALKDIELSEKLGFGGDPLRKSLLTSNIAQTRKDLEASLKLYQEFISKRAEAEKLAARGVSQQQIDDAQKLLAEYKTQANLRKEYELEVQRIREAGKITGKDVTAELALAKEAFDKASGAVKALKEANKSAAESEKERAAAIKDLVMIQKDFIEGQVKAREEVILNSDKQNDTLREQIKNTRESILEAQIGESAYAALELTRLRDAIATNEQTIANAKLNGATADAIVYAEGYNETLKEQLRLKEELGNVKQIEKSFKAEKERIKDLEEARVKATKDANDKIERANDRMYRDLSRSITDSIVRGFESGLSFVDNFKQAIRNAFKSFVVNIGVNFFQQGLQAVFGNVTKSILGSVGGIFSSSALAAQSGGVGGIFDQAKNIFNVVTKGFDAANIAFEQGIQQFGTFLTKFGGIGESIGGAISQFSGAISTALPYAGAAIKLLQGDVKGATFTGAGTALGSVLGGPVGGAIGGALGSLAGGLFGGEKKLPRYYTVLPSAYKSGTFQSGKAYTGSDSKGILTGAIDPLTQLSKSFATALGTVLEAFGKDADITMSALLYKKNNTIGRFEATIGGKTYKIDFDGGEDVNETFKKLVKETFTTVFVKALKGQGLGVNINNLFTGLKTQDEVVKMADALVNLANAQTGLKDKFNITIGQTAKLAKTMGSTTKETIAYINAMATLGAEAKTVGQSIMDMKQKLIDAFTGAISDANAVIEKFNSAKDSAKFLREKRGVYDKETYTTELPKSIEEYDALLKSINKTTNEGIALFGELLKLRGDFVLFTNAINELKGSVSSSIYSLLSPTEQLAQLQKELADVFASINRTVPTSVDELIALGNSIDYTTEAGLTLASQFPRLVSAFSAVKQAADQNLANAKQALIEAFDAERQRLQGIIDNVKEAEDKLKTAFDAKKLGIEDTINKFKSFGDSIKAFRLSLGERTTANADPLAIARQRFDATAALAMKGNEEALGNIQSASTDYLDAFEMYSGDFVSYMKAFAYVSDTLNKVETTAYTQADVAQTQLDALKAQVSKLISIDETNQSIESIMVEVRNTQATGSAAQVALTALNAQQISLLGTINNSVLSVADAIKQYNAAKTAATDTTTATQVARTSVANMSASQLVAAVKTAGGYSTSSEAIKAVQAANDGHITSAIAKEYLRSTYSTQYYANGGAFTNGIAYDPVAFNTGMMGEAGPEAIMPLTSINGRLGVSTNNSEMVQQLEVISEKISRLESAQIATAQNTGKVARIVERADNGDSINVTVVT